MTQSNVLNCSGALPSLPCECFQVAADGEHATVFLREWPADAVGRYCGGQLVVHSTFGTFGHTWVSCAGPFKQFLLGLSFDSLMGKCFGERARVYDGEATFNTVARDILMARKAKELSAEEAAELWADWHYHRETIEGAEDGFYLTMDSLQGVDGDSRNSVLSEPGVAVCQKDDPQAAGFWAELWPLICEVLRPAVSSAGVIEFSTTT